MATVQLVIAGLTTGCVYALVALGFHLIYRTTHIVDFAQGEKVALGGLFALSLMSGLQFPLWLAILVSTGIGALLGVVYDRTVIQLARRRSESVTIIATVGVSLIILNGQGLVWGRKGKPFPPFTPQWDTVSVLGINIVVQYLWAWLLMLVVLGILYLVFEKTLWGQAMVATAQDELGARLTGINVSGVRTASFAMASALAVLAGIIVAPITAAGGDAGLPLAIKGFTGAMVGGLDSAPGVVLGSLVVGVLEALTAGVVGYGYRDPVTYALLFVTLLLRPEGLFRPREGREV